MGALLPLARNLTQYSTKLWLPGAVMAVTGKDSRNPVSGVFHTCGRPPYVLMEYDQSETTDARDSAKELGISDLFVVEGVEDAVHPRRNLHAVPGHRTRLHG
jgi:hypothetical protein